MTDDPNSIADALDQWAPKLTELIGWLDMIDKVAEMAGRSDLVSTEMQDDLRQMSADAATAARLLREQADTADRLAAAEVERDKFREHSVLLNSVSWRLLEATGRVGPGDETHEYDVSGCEMVDELVSERDDLAARLSALTDAIGDPAWLEWWTGALADIPRTLKIRLAALAAAVQPPDPKGTK